MIPVLLGISFVVFFLMDLTPGTPADIILGDLATSEAKAQMRYYPYLVIIPGITIAITVLSINLIGDGLRDALDPKLKN